MAWDDPAAREALVDFRARDGYVLARHGNLAEPVERATRRLATVLGQGLETGQDGHCAHCPQSRS